MQHFTSVSSLLATLGYPPPEHPMLGLLECDGTCNHPGDAHTSDFYRIGFKKMKEGEILYGKTKYDHSQGSMIFIKPRQIMDMREIVMDEKGFFIIIHEDYLNGHRLHDEIRNYHFFDYDVNEALHLSPKEEKLIWDLFYKILGEYNNNPDEFSKEIMLGHVESILQYSQRFYKRQFLSRAELSGATATRFNNSLYNYFASGSLEEKGLPTVKSMASELNLSSKYLSDMLKQETGKTALELIHIFLVSEAKNLLKGEGGTVAEIAYSLGFENLPYFSRLFKKETGLSPGQFKKLNLN